MSSTVVTISVQPKQEQPLPQTDPVSMTSPFTVANQYTPGSASPVQRSFNPIIAESYPKRQSMGLGITLTFAAILVLIFNIVGSTAGDFSSSVRICYSFVSILAISSSFGIAATSQSRNRIKSFMGVCIFCAVCSFMVFCLEVIDTQTDVNCDESIFNYSYWCPNNVSLVIACKLIKASIAVVVVIVCIWGSVICCQAVCCCSRTNSPVVDDIPYDGQQILDSQLSEANSQMITLSVSPPSYQLAAISNGYPGPYQPTQEQSVEDQSPPQYSVSSEASSLSFTPAMPLPPAYDVEKERFQ